MLCLKGNCTHVTDNGLDILQKYFHEFVKKILTTCFILASHESRTVITCRDIIHSQEVMFRQRENTTIRMSGYVLNTVMTDDDDEDDDMSISRMSTSEAYLEASDIESESSDDPENDEKDSDDAINSDEEKKLRRRQSEEQRSELRCVIEVEDDNDINAIVYNPTLKSMITVKLVSLHSYLQLFKDTSPTKFISVEAFNMLTGICEHQVQLNLLGGESLVQVVYDGMIVPISVMMKLSQEVEEEKTESLASKFMAVERECLSSLALARSHQKELLGVLRRLTITTSSSTSAQEEFPVPEHAHCGQLSDEAFFLQRRLIEEQTTTTFLKEQLQESRTAINSLQDTLKAVNEMAFSLRALTSPRPAHHHTSTVLVRTSDAPSSYEL